MQIAGADDCDHGECDDSFFDNTLNVLQVFMVKTFPIGKACPVCSMQGILFLRERK